nr:MAG TPA: hypothetical protein [Caudoviricetes sp.]
MFHFEQNKTPESVLNFRGILLSIIYIFIYLL